MKQITVDCLVIGGGAAGMAAAVEVQRRGYTAALVERESELGGVLMQCIHNGFGLEEFKEELTGPEYAERWIDELQRLEIPSYVDTTVMEIDKDEAGGNLCTAYSPHHGTLRFTARTVVLAMGCRERNRGNIMIPGTRPAGVYTAGLAQRMVNIDGFVPGKEVVIVGSGDIGLIMARRMKWVGSNVHGVVEIQPYPSGLTRNISQCLNDFDIPLYLNHTVSYIYGRDRVEAVDVTPFVDGIPDESKTFTLPCDTLLLSVGLVPENELSKQVGIELNSHTNGPLVDSRLMTNEEGIFAAGNVLHVHDLVDYVSDEARRAGSFVAAYLEGDSPARELRVKAGANVRYVNPTRLDPDSEISAIYLRPLVVANKAALTLTVDGEVVKRFKKPHVQPSEMIRQKLGPKLFRDLELHRDSVLEVSIHDV